MNRARPFILALLALVISAIGQSPGDPNEGCHVTYDSMNEVHDFSWWGRSGQSYFIQHSEDLVHWSYYPTIVVGQDAVASMGFQTSAPNYFLRLEIEADPFNTDSDGDGIPDGWEVIHGLNPHYAGDALWMAAGGLSYLVKYQLDLDPDDADSDDDGAEDGAEVEQGYDPKFNQSFPPRWRRFSRQISVTYNDYPWGGSYGQAWTWPLWIPGAENLLYLWDTPGFPAFSALLAAQAPFPSGVALAGHDLPSAALGYADTYWLPGPGFQKQDGWMEEHRVYLEVKPAPTAAITRQMLRVTERKIDGGTPAYQVEPVTVTIAAGQTLSAPVDLTPAFTTNPATGNHSEEVSVGLAAIQLKTYSAIEAGPDKPHKLNIATRQDERTFYGQVWEKCVSKVWNTSNTVNLIDYLDGGIGNHAIYEGAVKWKVNGTEQNSHELSLGNEPEDNMHVHFYVEVLPKNGTATIDRLIITVVPRSTKTKFDTWYATEKADLGWLGELVNLFASFNTTPLDGHYRRPDRNFNPFLYSEPGAHNTRMHPNSYFEARSYQTAGEHGHQMNFNENGVLLRSGVSAGSADRAAPFPHWYDHGKKDVEPFIWALQLDGTPADQDSTTLTKPIMHEGAYLKKYSECRPTIANDKPILADGATP